MLLDVWIGLKFDISNQVLLGMVQLKLASLVVSLVSFLPYSFFLLRPAPVHVVCSQSFRPLLPAPGAAAAAFSRRRQPDARTAVAAVRRSVLPDPGVMLHGPPGLSIKADLEPITS